MYKDNQKFKLVLTRFVEKPGAEKDDRTTPLLSVSTSSYDDEHLKQQRHFSHGNCCRRIRQQMLFVFYFNLFYVFATILFKEKNVYNTKLRTLIVTDGPIENVIRQRKRKNLNRGRQQKRGTADSSGEQGVPESEMVPESSDDEGKVGIVEKTVNYSSETEALKEEHDARWKRILLLIVAVTVHNIPEGNCH